MKTSYLKPLVFAVFQIVFAWSVANLHSQESEAAQAEKAFSQLDSSSAQLKSRRAELLKQVQSFAAQIQTLKDKQSLNYFHSQRLDRLLKDSQELANEIESLDFQLVALENRLSTVGTELVKLYDSDIQKSLTLLESSPARRDSLIRIVAALRGKRERIKQKVTPSDLDQIKIAKLAIEPDDSSKQIGLKADLLKDQEDKLRRLAERLDKQSQEIEKELALKNRMSDLVADIALFDQQEEALGILSQGASSGAVSATEDGQESGFNQRISLSEGGLLVAQKDFDFANLSPEQLEEAIDQLSRRQQRIQAQADSLARQAELFYQAAKGSRKR